MNNDYKMALHKHIFLYKQEIINLFCIKVGKTVHFVIIRSKHLPYLESIINETLSDFFVTVHNDVRNETDDFIHHLAFYCKERAEINIVHS